MAIGSPVPRHLNRWRVHDLDCRSHGQQFRVKSEPIDSEPSVVGVPASVASVAPASVWEGDYTSIQMASVDPATPFEFMIGTGSKTLQFFYQNPNEDVKIGFPPVRVETDEEVNCVVALVAEKAEDFNRRNNLKKSKAPVQYYSSA